MQPPDIGRSGGDNERRRYAAARLCTLAPSTPRGSLKPGSSTPERTLAGRHPVDCYEPTATDFESDMLELRRRLLGAPVAILVVTIIGVFLASSDDSQRLRQQLSAPV